MARIPASCGAGRPRTTCRTSSRRTSTRGRSSRTYREEASRQLTVDSPDCRLSTVDCELALSARPHSHPLQPARDDRVSDDPRGDDVGAVVQLPLEDDETLLLAQLFEGHILPIDWVGE